MKRGRKKDLTIQDLDSKRYYSTKSILEHLQSTEVIIWLSALNIPFPKQILHFSKVEIKLLEQSTRERVTAPFSQLQGGWR